MRQTAPAWSIRGRSYEKIKEKVPGPGTYSPTMTNFEACPAVKIGLGNRLNGKIRFSQPGPADYSPDKITCKPALTVFNKAKRPEIHKKSSNPGPGSYNPHAEDSSPKFKIPIASDPQVKDYRPGPGQYTPRSTFTQVFYSVPKARRSSWVDPRSISGRDSDHEFGPGPGAYDPEEKRESAPNYSIAKAGRYSDRKFTYPGPGSYFVGLGTCEKASPKYTISSRRASSLSLDGPGPAYYNPIKDLNSGTYSFSKSNHMKPRLPDQPGPGSYNISGRLSSGPLIGKSTRQALSQPPDTPGPGAYNPCPSHPQPA